MRQDGRQLDDMLVKITAHFGTEGRLALLPLPLARVIFGFSALSYFRCRAGQEMIFF